MPATWRPHAAGLAQQIAPDQLGPKIRDQHSPIANVEHPSAISLINNFAADVPNWRSANADCVSGPSLRFLVQSSRGLMALPPTHNPVLADSQ